MKTQSPARINLLGRRLTLNKEYRSARVLNEIARVCREVACEDEKPLVVINKRCIAEVWRAIRVQGRQQQRFKAVDERFTLRLQLGIKTH